MSVGVLFFIQKGDRHGDEAEATEEGRAHGLGFKRIDGHEQADIRTTRRSTQTKGREVMNPKIQQFSEQWNEAVRRLHEQAMEIAKRLENLFGEIKDLSALYDEPKPTKHRHERQGWRAQRFYMPHQVIDRRPHRTHARTNI
ncbi:hypothetical protein G4V62_13895 [Bacillaceae bacterium SIJ1]|uniref:hypothetical protein n=1 Tax=Litoribacterium kuwaitense TaxID=1398745 RepID=UPI0013EB096D|nr:hypothetical protein [Litoribacterium kuwaitense]NGP45987.1 hypothetical protein [Litoribacterium kuwaitense]